MISKNNNYLNYLIYILILVLIGCGNDRKMSNEVNIWIGKKLILPNDSLIRNYNANKSPNPLTKKVKILAAINGDCSVCYEELKIWKNYINEIDTSQVGLIFVVSTFNKLIEFNDINNSLLKFNYPYFQDDGEKIVRENNLSDDRLLKTFLLDSTNKVILIGNPTMHESLYNLYQMEINKRIR